MKPIGKYILINTIEEEIKTEAGLFLTAEDTKMQRYKKGEVVESGSDVTVIKKGDVIYYDGRSGYTQLIGSNKYTIITQGDVVVVL